MGPSLDELEGCTWGEPNFDSHLVTTCHRLRTKPIDQFTVEDLRIMIGQDIGLKYLLPLALDVLDSDPLAEGDYYAGDLLSAVLSADASCYAAHPNLTQRAVLVCQRGLGIFEDEHDDLKEKCRCFLERWGR